MLERILNKISLRELVIYVGCALLAIIGLIFVILGIVASYLPITNALRKIQEGFSWRYVGLIIVASSTLIVIVTLLVDAKKVDRISDREARRKQRLQAMMSDANKEQETVIVDEHGKIETKKENTIETADIETKAIEDHSNNEIKDAVINDNIGDK